MIPARHYTDRKVLQKEREKKIALGHKTEANIASVMYSYVGTDDQFDDFLKMMIHDYLSVDHPYTNRTADFVVKVETEVA